MNCTRLLLARTSSVIASRSGHRLVIQRHGDPLKVLALEKQERPKILALNNIVCGVLAATVNPADIGVVEGTYPLRPGLPNTGGIDGVAQVLEVGPNVTKFKVGDYVWPYTQRIGMFQTYIQVKEDHLSLADKRLNLTQLATLQANPATAYLMLKMSHLQQGHTLIQNAANSAVGQSVIQLAKAWRINTVNLVRDRSDMDEVRKLLTDLGATHVFTDKEFDASGRELWKKIPRPKLVLNAVGGKQIVKLAGALDKEGLIITYGGLSFQPVQGSTGSLVFNDQKYVGFWLGRRELKQLTEHDRQEWTDMLKELSDLAVAGKLKPPVCETLPCTEWKKAFAPRDSKTIKHQPKKILTFYDPQKND